MNGEAFHLIKIASLLAANKTIIGIESQVKIQFKKDVEGEAKNFGSMLTRRVDIVTGTVENPKWHEVKSLSFNTQINDKKSIPYNRNFTALNLKKIETQANTNATVGKVKATKVAKNQFYAKEFFIDRAWAGDSAATMNNKMEWTFHDYNAKMPEMFKKGKQYVMGSKSFEQCGVGTLSACSTMYGSNQPLTKVRDRLPDGIKTPNNKSVESIVAATILGEMEPDEVAAYLAAAKAKSNSYINSLSAKDAILDAFTPSVTCPIAP